MGDFFQPAPSVDTDFPEIIPIAQMPAIYRDYGPLFAEEGEKQREIGNHAWSAWWYPIRDRGLFAGHDGEPGALQKYDAYVRALHGYDSEAAKYEEENLYDPQAEDWEGLCHAWALASLVEPEPTKPVDIAGIHFGVSDLKALLIKTYEQYDARYYGERFTSYDSGDWSNIQPQLFHRFVLGELIERGRPFIMNKKPGMEVWNSPIYKADMLLTRDPADPSVYHAQTWLVGAALLDTSSDFVGSRPEVDYYTYDLYTKKDSRGRDFAFAGKWTGLSADEHPSVLTVVPAPGFAHQSRNPEIRNEIVQEILRSAGN